MHIRQLILYSIFATAIVSLYSAEKKLNRLEQLSLLTKLPTSPSEYLDWVQTPLAATFEHHPAWQEITRDIKDANSRIRAQAAEDCLTLSMSTDRSIGCIEALSEKNDSDKAIKTLSLAHQYTNIYGIRYQIAAALALPKTE